MSSAGRGITCTPTSSPTRRAAAAPGIRRRFHRADVATDDRGHQAGVDFLPADEDHVGGLDHRVGGLDHAHQAARLDHADRFANISFLGATKEVYIGTACLSALVYPPKGGHYMLFPRAAIGIGSTVLPSSSHA